MINWIKKNKLDFVFLLLILLMGTFLRFYQIAGHATFLGDEGRDALVVKHMIIDHKLTLLGPTASFGNLYLGPIYYYFMLLPLWLTHFNPVGPAMMVASFGVLTIFLVWKIGYDFFGRVEAVIAASLYAVSQAIIIHTRSSWNPNPVPFFAALAIYSLFKTIKDKNGRWLILVGGCLGIALQLHYVAFVLMALVVLIFLILRIKLAWKWYFWSIFSFFFFLSPQILFELRHKFINTQAMINFFLRKGEFATTAGIGLDKLAPFTLYDRLFNHFLAIDISWLGLLLAVISGLIGLLFLFTKRAFKTKNLGLTVLLLWIFFGVLLTPLYRGKIHDHYLGFLFPAPFLLLGFTLSRFWIKRWGKVLVVLVTAILIILNLSKTNFFSGSGPNYQIQRSRLIAQTIAADVDDQKFNIALVSPTGDFMAMNYRYFLELFGKKPEDYGNFNNIDVLYVIEGAKWVNPEQLGLWEVGTFGPFVTTKDWNFDFQVQIYRLEHQK